MKGGCSVRMHSSELVSGSLRESRVLIGLSMKTGKGGGGICNFALLSHMVYKKKLRKIKVRST